MRGKKGFTMIEILIVLIILGALAALAIPVYNTTIEKARRQEAIQNLTAAREAELRYFQGRGQFTGSYADLDFDPANTASDPPGTNRHYTYASPVLGAGGNSFTITATRNTVDGGNGASTVQINQAGALTYT